MVRTSREMIDPPEVRINKTPRRGTFPSKIPNNFLGGSRGLPTALGSLQLLDIQHH